MINTIENSKRFNQILKLFSSIQSLNVEYSKLSIALDKETNDLKTLSAYLSGSTIYLYPAMILEQDDVTDDFLISIIAHEIGHHMNEYDFD